MAHVDFARHVVRRTVVNLPDRVDIENLEAAGMLGLVEASQRYDESRGIDFRSFAYPRVRGAVLDELRRNSPLSKQMLQKIGRVRQACERLDPPASHQAIAHLSRLSISEVEDCLIAMRTVRSQPFEETAIEGVPRQSVAEPQDVLEFKEMRSLLADCIEALPEQQRIVLSNPSSGRNKQRLCLNPVILCDNEDLQLM
jgi:RNA polymerase sigma factor for flagellar operon FliA